MTDDERDELLRWAAEDVLGWEVCETHGCTEDWTTPNGHRNRTDLLGWPGFGLAVEAARARGLSAAVQYWPDTRQDPKRGFHAWFGRSVGLWDCWDADDPALAAWAALREALVAVPANPYGDCPNLAGPPGDGCPACEWENAQDALTLG